MASPRSQSVSSFVSSQAAAAAGACSRVRVIPPWEFAREDQPNMWNWARGGEEDYADQCRAYQERLRKGPGLGIAREAKPLSPWQDQVRAQTR